MNLWVVQRVNLHSREPGGQNPSCGGPSLPRGTSENRCWQTISADNPLFSCCLCSSRVQVWVGGHSAGPQSSIATTNTLPLSWTTQVPLHVPAACGHTQHWGGCMSLCNVPRKTYRYWVLQESTRPCTHISDPRCKLLNLPQLWLKMPAMCLQVAEVPRHQAAAGPAPSAPRPHTPCQHRSH